MLLDGSSGYVSKYPSLPSKPWACGKYHGVRAGMSESVLDNSSGSGKLSVSSTGRAGGSGGSAFKSTISNAKRSTSWLRLLDKTLLNSRLGRIAQMRPTLTSPDPDAKPCSTQRRARSSYSLSSSLDIVILVTCGLLFSTTAGSLASC